MGKMTTVVKENRTVETTKRVENFMGGYSYELNPLDTLKMITASSIFGEPQYYRAGEFAEKGAKKDAVYSIDKCMIDYAILSKDKFGGKKTSEIMEMAIDEALQYDFGATLNWAVTLRREYLMRLNPQIIMVRASLMTDERKAFTEKNPGLFAEINNKVMFRADDVIAQITYYLYKKGNKKQLPTILKNSWRKKIESLTQYELYKYKNKGIGMLDSVRICHANNTLIDEFMQKGTIDIAEESQPWETLRSGGKSWAEILNTIDKMPHMAALRNLRGIFSEIDNYETTVDFMNDLKSGVKKGKQFPFRYMSAKREVSKCEDVHNKVVIEDGLEECLDIACENLPMLKGYNAFLSDNSGSAWGSCTSEYGTVTVAEIDNLSSVIGAANSERGVVVKFGDDMKKFEISKRQGILAQAEKISSERSSDVGGSTEGGIWKFFKEALDKKIVYDNIFIFSDMQAGHGGLYGTYADKSEYCKLGFDIHGYVDVAKLINEYRNKVNHTVNVYCIQTAGYNNVLVPENGYRTNILYGWTGKELVYADMMNKFWDEIDARKQQ